MTIGEKIVHLRISYDISQMQLAKLLKVSRQSISKWESGENIPQVDKIAELCNIFKISADELINDEIIIHRNKKIKPIISEGFKFKYFGTDGFRGEANVDLTALHAFKIGRFLGWFYSNPKYNCQKIGYRPRIVIGKDTRRSSYMLEYALASGAASSGADVELMHVTTTPSVSYISKMDGFDAGVMITASHNPFYDNGIKILNGNGEKLDEGVTYLIECYLDNNLRPLGIDGDDLPLAEKENIGSINDYSSGRNRYIGYLISLARHSMKNLRIGLDCANGASWMIAKSVFAALGAKLYLINNEPDGININKNAGSTHIELLSAFVKEKKLDVGFAFDGDADRCLAVDENGDIVDGDKIMYLLALKLKQEGRLDNNSVVATIMSNSGFEKALKKQNINLVRTKVGDRFVYEKMQEEGYVLGGEQSGHVIIKKYATTGDGILTALRVAEQMLSTHQKLSELVAPVKLFPQVLKNVRVISKSDVMEDNDVKIKFNEINKQLEGKGRILLRESGTEPLIRIMVEAPSIEECNKYIERLYNVIKKGGHLCE